MEVSWNGGTPSSHPCSDFPLSTNHFGDTPLMETPKSKIPKIAAPTILMWKTWISIGEVTTCHGFSAHCPTKILVIYPRLCGFQVVYCEDCWKLLGVLWAHTEGYIPVTAYVSPFAKENFWNMFEPAFVQRKTDMKLKKKYHWKVLFLSQSFFWGVNFLFQNDHHLLEMNQKLIFTDDSATAFPHINGVNGGPQRWTMKRMPPCFFSFTTSRANWWKAWRPGSGGSEVKVDVVHLSPAFFK